MKYRIFIFLLLFLFSCKDKVGLTQKIEKINISFKYAKDAKIRGKILLKKDDKRFLIFNNLIKDSTSDKKDNTNDTSKDNSIDGIEINITKKDKTSDLNKNLYIYTEKEIDFYENKLKEIQEIFLSSFRQKFKNIKINDNTDEESSDVNQNKSIDIEAVIVSYNPGEFNRIKNISTEIEIEFKVKNKELKIDKLYRKKFIAKSIPELPTERIRLINISEKYANFFYDKFNEIKIEEKKENKNKKEEKK